MDDGQFDSLTRRVGGLALPRLPRRALTRLLSGAALSGTLGLLGDLDAGAARKLKGKGGAHDQSKDAAADKKKCKKAGSKCDKKTCKKKGKKCCCGNITCKNSVCESKCPTTVNTDLDWGGSGSGNGKFDNPYGITTDPDGNVYVTDTDNFRVQVFNANGAFDFTFGSQGVDDDEFQEPLGIAFGEDSGGASRIYVTDPAQAGSRKLRSFNLSGVFKEKFGQDLTEPFGVAVDSDNNIWVIDQIGEVFLFDDSADLVTSWTPSGNGDLAVPEGIGIFEENNQTFVYVADTGHDRMVKFEYVNNSSSGLEFVDEAGSTGSGSDRFNEPAGIAVDECGNLWVADRLNDRIQILDKNLNFKSNVTNNLDRPTDVAFSPNGKSLYVVDSGNDRIKKYSLS